MTGGGAGGVTVGEEAADPSPPLAKGATGFGMTTVGGVCVEMGVGFCCGVGIGGGAD